MLTTHCIDLPSDTELVHPISLSRAVLIWQSLERKKAAESPPEEEADSGEEDEEVVLEEGDGDL